MGTILNYSKLNNEILKAFSRGSKNKQRLLFEKIDNDIYMTDGHYLFKYYKGFFPFNLEILTEALYTSELLNFSGARGMLDDIDKIDTFWMLPIYEQKTIDGLKVTVFKPHNKEQNFEIHINSDFLKFVNMDNDYLTFYCAGANKPLYILDTYNSDVLGLILPIKFN